MSGKMRRNLDTKEAREFWDSVDAASSDPLELTRRSQRESSQSSTDDLTETEPSRSSASTDGMHLD